jgi:hypothetical protein
MKLPQQLCFSDSKFSRRVIKLGDEADEKKLCATRRDSEKDAAHHARSTHCATEESCRDTGKSPFEKASSIDLRETLMVASGSGDRITTGSARLAYRVRH